MKLTAKLYTGVFLAMALALSPLAQAQENSVEPDVSKKIAKLEQQIQSLQSEVESLKNATSKKVVSSDPAPAPGMSSASGAALVASPEPAASAAPADPPAAAPAPTVPATPASVFDSIAINGLVDGYYSYDFEHPHVAALSVPLGTAGLGSPNSELAGFRSFDAPSSTMMLNMIELTVAKAPTLHTSPLGFDLTLGYGNAINVINSTDPAGLGFAHNIKEAYLSYDAPVGKGLEIDFGKFVTSMGQEVIETNANWNYTRGILFSYAIPYYHFGLRTKYTFNDKYSMGLYLVNGWNDIQDNNTGKSVMVDFGWNMTKKITWTQNYMFGPEMTGTNSHWRQSYDTEIGYNPTSKLSLAWNFDYGRGDQPAGFTNPVWWSGVAGYVRYAFANNYAFAGRYEFYDDHSGFTTGKPQDINEFTTTFERTIAKNLLTRLEYRRDMSNELSLFKGTTPVKNQDTLDLGFVYTFDIHDAQ